MATNWVWRVNYELLPFAFDHKLGRTVSTNIYSLVIVVTPLVFLMVDQVTDLKMHGIDSTIISGSDRIERSQLPHRDWRVIVYCPQFLKQCLDINGGIVLRNQIFQTGLWPRLSMKLTASLNDKHVYRYRCCLLFDTCTHIYLCGRKDF